MPGETDHFENLNAKLDQLRTALVEMRHLLSAQSAREPSLPVTLESANRELHAIQVSIRLLETETLALEARLERAVRETWELKAKRADTTARLKNRDALLERIQHSRLWKTVKPLWKLFNRSRQSQPDANSDLTFALDWPISWKTNREILFLKGWCFSRSGREIAGVRAKVGRKARFARYGLERTDLAVSMREFPLARHSGFTIEVRVPPGISTVRLEAIEHGADWQLFFEHEVEREGGVDSGEELQSAELGQQDHSKGKVQRWGTLSADEAFERLKPLFQEQASRATPPEKPFFSLITPTYETKPGWLAEAALSLLQPIVRQLGVVHCRRWLAKPANEEIPGTPAPREPPNQGYVGNEGRHQRGDKPGARFSPGRLRLLPRPR